MGTLNNSVSQTARLPLLLVVTGAGGFLGNAIVAQARTCGHKVRAIVRREQSVPAAWRADPDIELAVLDLAEATARDALVRQLAGADAIVHAAARLEGTDAQHARDTVGSLEAVLAAIEGNAGPRPRVILAGSLSIYDAMSLDDGAILDETCPLEREPALREAYCRAKLQQEQAVTGAAATSGLEVRILRLGALYGPGHLWNAHFGPVVGPALLLIGDAGGEVPACHVDYGAAALVRAAEAPLVKDDRDRAGLSGHVEIINVVDPVRPTRRDYLDALERTGWRKRIIPVGRKWIVGLATMFARAGLTTKLPGLLRPGVLAARMKPLRYSNARLIERLGALPCLPFASVIAKAAGMPDDDERRDGQTTSKPGTTLTGPIAYLTGQYPRATDTFIQREVMSLRQLGVDVITCSIRRTPPSHHVGPEQRSEAAKTFNVLPAAANIVWSVPIHLGTLLMRPLRYLGTLRLAVASRSPGLPALLFQFVYFYEAVVLAHVLRKKGVVHLHNHIAMSSSSVAMLASAVSGIPYSFTIHGADEYQNATRWRLDEKIARAAFVVCVCHHGRSICMINSDRAHWSKLHIVHCGIDPDRYGDGAVRRSRLEAGCRLLFVGRIAPIKGVPVLFAALKAVLQKYPLTRLTMIGDGPDRAAMEAEAQALAIGHAVHFAGYKSQDEVAAALSDAEALVLSSFNEGLPVVLMEALAAGVPVVASQVSGIPELVRNGETGILVPPGSADDLAAAICELIADPAKRHRMGSAGRALVEREFNIAAEAVWLKQLLEAYARGQKVEQLRPAAVVRSGDQVASPNVVRNLLTVGH